MGFLIFSKYFIVIALFSWIFELLLRPEIYVVQIWVGFIFVSLIEWVLLVLII